MKKLIVYILSIVIVLTLTTCGNTIKMSEPPPILITAGSTKIEYVVGLNLWNGAIYDRLDTFYLIMKEDSDIEVPYINLGEIIQIESMGKVPDTIELKDYILNEKGEIKYTAKEVIEMPIQFTDGKGNYKLNPHEAALLSSNSKDYEPGKTIRGFKLTCSWGDKYQCEYAFIVRTDPYSY